MLTIFIGAVLASAISAILVFAQELLPARIGAVAGLFFDFAFGVRQRDKINVPRTHYFLGEVSSARFEGAGVLAIGVDSGRLPTLQS